MPQQQLCLVLTALNALASKKAGAAMALLSMILSIAARVLKLGYLEVLSSYITCRTSQDSSAGSDHLGCSQPKPLSRHPDAATAEPTCLC